MDNGGIKFSSARNVIKAADQAPILNTETTLIDVHPKIDTGDTKKVPFVVGNTQASLGFNYVHASLTKIVFRIYWYREEVSTTNPYQKTAGTITAGNEVVSPHTAEFDTTDGRLSYDFQIPACDGLKITVQSTGTTAASSLTEIHLALRTN